MAGKVRNIIEKFNNKADIVSLNAALRVPINSRWFLFLLFVKSVGNFFLCRRKFGHIIRYKKAINNSQSNIIFLFNCFLSRSYEWIFFHLISEDPSKYLKYVSISGEDYVRSLMDKDTGVILISGHFGPTFRTVLFKEALGKNVSVFADRGNKKIFCASPERKYKIIASNPIYSVGEEKQFQEGLLRKEWIIFLNDIPMPKRNSNHHTLFGKNIHLSEFPFKVSLKHNVPILFVGTRRVKLEYHVSIMPINEFQSPAEGLAKYTALVEELLHRDPYAGYYIADNHF